MTVSGEKRKVSFNTFIIPIIGIQQPIVISGSRVVISLRLKDPALPFILVLLLWCPGQLARYWWMLGSNVRWL
jgi:hypothetical protein